MNESTSISATGPQTRSDNNHKNKKAPKRLPGGGPGVPCIAEGRSGSVTGETDNGSVLVDLGSPHGIVATW